MLMKTRQPEEDLSISMPEHDEVDTFLMFSSPKKQVTSHNIDKNIKARYIRTGSNHKISLHCFHISAVQDGIDFNHLPNHHPDGCLNTPQKRALTLIPSIEDDNSLLHNFSILLSRLLCSNMT